MDLADTSPPYAIRGGKEGKKRLDLLARVLLPTTMQLLGRVGLINGMNCLDLGCGGGHVTMLMARIVGPEGRVTGTDSDAAILALAKQDAEAAKIGNLTFRQLDACACVWHEEFDLTYARFLLSHLNEPQKCLASMVEACAPGGRVVIEDTDFAGSFCFPVSAAYERYKEAYQQLVHRRGGDSNIGPKLARLLGRAGVHEIEINVIQPVHIRGEGKLMAAFTMSRISDALIAEGLATEDEVQKILSGLNEIAADTETLISLPRIFQLSGKRAV
ncbi:MAG TPA: methyltransferase domain-containing protein [Chthoniobacterales bacterium]|nr:methyltransferase domain-containing protein [Chthoniobacterales bacterium]